MSLNRLKTLKHSARTSPLAKNGDPKNKKLKLSVKWNKFREYADWSTNAGTKLRLPTLFPEIRWADKQEVWDVICKKEYSSYIRPTWQQIEKRNEHLIPRMRAILFDWLTEVASVYKLHRESFYLAIDFFDRYIGTTKGLSKWRVQLVGITCLLIASKIEEIYPPELKDFAYVTDKACTEEDIKESELVILQALKWQLSPMTPNGWVKLFLQFYQVSQTIKETGSNPPDNIDLILPEFSIELYVDVMRLIDLCILDPGSLTFPYSIIAASAISYCSNRPLAIRASGYEWSELADCIDWMSPFAFVLREFADEVDFSPEFEDVPCDETHNIQPHSFEIDMLDRAEERQTMIEQQKTCSKAEIQTLSSLDMTPPEELGDTSPGEKSHTIHYRPERISKKSTVFLSPKPEPED